MKRLFYVLVLLFFVSCSTTHKVLVYGTPGYEILTTDDKKIGTIQNNGVADLSIDGDDLYELLIARNPKTNQSVPFAIDYKHHNYIGDKFLYYSGLVLAFPTCMLTGLWGMPASMRLRQETELWEFKYLSRQNANTDMNFADILDTGYQKQIQISEQSPRTDSKVKSGSDKEKSAIVAASSKRRIKGNLKPIAGIYQGTGELLLNNKVIERYPNMKVVISYADNGVSYVEIFEGDENYFDSKLKYRIQKSYDETTILVHEDCSEAKIVFKQNGSIDFIHPSVGFEDDVFTLSITAQLLSE